MFSCIEALLNEYFLVIKYFYNKKTLFSSYFPPKTKTSQFFAFQKERPLCQDNFYETFSSVIFGGLGTPAMDTGKNPKQGRSAMETKQASP
jgi:hypothetical protein